MSTAPARGRFAPSPTGPLHFGSLVAAIASWLDARHAGAEWLVRIEDIDETRTVPGAADEILRTLDRFGLHWDGQVAWQSRRKRLYAAALERLRGERLVYRCRCSRREIADSGLRGIDGIVYPGTCRTLGLASDAPGADRLRVPPGPVEVADRVQGRISQDVAAEVGDFVLKRRDGLYAYQLAVVVDDADQGISDVVRGADLWQSTPRQLLLQRALHVPTPRYLHFPVATDGAGEKLSKQTQAGAVDASRAPELIAIALRFLGQPRATSRIPGEMLAEAARAWDAGRIAKTVSARVPGV
jgi:glutamyl-Q tRNA(Asp) synthetase